MADETEPTTPPAASSPETPSPENGATDSPATATANQAAPASTAPSSSPGSDIEFLLNQAEEAIASVDAPVASGVQATPYQLREIAGEGVSPDKATFELLRDVELDLRIELGRTEMSIEDVLRLRKGSVVPLDKLAGDPVDVFVNGRLVARGEVLVLDDNFCVRVAQLVSGEEVA